MSPPEAGGTVYAYADLELIEGQPVSRNAECAEGNNWTTLEVPGCAR